MQEVSDVLRGTLVLALAGLDALVLDCVAAAAPAAARNGTLGESVRKWVKEDPAAFLSVLATADPPGEMVEIVRANLGTTTFQKAEAIAGILHGVLGAESPWDRASELLNEDEDATYTYAAPDVVEELNTFVSRRNRIAHSGDRNDAGTATQPIQRAYVKEASRVIRAVGIAVAEIAEEIEG